MHVLLISGFVLMTLASCGDDEIDGKAGLQIADYTTEIQSIADIENNGDPSDIEVSFTAAAATESKIKEYRFFYALEGFSVDTSEEGLTALELLNPSHYTLITPAQFSDKHQLGFRQVSVNGDEMVMGEGYVLYIMTVGRFNDQEVLALSQPSQSFSIIDTRILDIETFTVSGVTIEDVDNDGNASDFTVSFSGGSMTDYIEEYWMVVSKSAAASSVNIDAIRSLDTDRLMVVMNDDDSYEIELSADMKDTDGDTFNHGVEYQLFIMTVGNFKEEPVFALAKTSDPVTLIEKTETTTLVTGYRGNGSITLDSDGNLYVNEFGAGDGNAGLGTSAFKISPSGDVEEFVSNLSGPVGNTLDADGNYYLNNGNEGEDGDFMKITPDGTQTILATIDGYPTNILTGTDGNFYIANWTKPKLHRVTSDGTVTDFVNDDRLTGCTGIAYDDNENILVGNFGTGLIMSIDKEGLISEIATIPTVVSGFVIGYIDFFEGHVYATGYGSNKIYKVSLDGTVEEFAGNGELDSVDGELARASFQTPNGIAIDKTRRILYVSENALGRPTNLRAIPLD